MRCKTLCALLLLLSLCHDSLATHLRAGEIRARRINCNANAYEITLLVYININSSVLVGGSDDFLYFGDGTSALIPEILTYEVIDPELGIGLVKFSVDHIYPGPGRYKIAYSESNRNIDQVLNYSGIERFYLETSILIEPGICNTSPLLSIAPIDRACSGITFFHNPGAFDEDLDSLSFSLVVPQKSEASPLSGYKLPNDERFYNVTPYNASNEAKTGPPVFNIDERDGTVTWDAPGMIGEYVMAIKITEWKFNATARTWYEAGYLIRDMQIIVEECQNQRPLLNIIEQLCVTAGSLIDLKAQAFDPDGDSVLIEYFSDIFEDHEILLKIIPSNHSVVGTQGPDNAVINVRWQTDCGNVRDRPYKIIFKISDRPSSGPSLTKFYTLNIKVIAPPPELEKVSVNPVLKHATIEWKSYPCDNAKAFQVWRRISSFDYESDQCQSGIPSYLHYQLITESAGATTSFTDVDLAFGAQYCYRIIALVGEGRSASKISLDTCFIPKPAEAPVILNVSVQKTDEENGKVFIRWTHPFDIDAMQYPGPYSYIVLRKDDTNPSSDFELITPQPIVDTVFTDSNLNTLQKVYRYKIHLYVPALTQTVVDTSAEASSVYVVTNPVAKGVALRWMTNTPWSNYSESDPYHLIFRAPSENGPFTLIDSVNVHANGFEYVDHGQGGGTVLAKGLYYYQIVTRGTYGNPKITSPLENYSQVASGHILDTIPPCKPKMTVAKINCSEFACDGSDYYTLLEWAPSTADCDDDVIAYDVMIQDDSSSRYVLLARVTETHFIHSPLTSLNQCYRLISFDQAGNQSDTSDVVCNSNCLNFTLPNIITPGSSDNNNDVLTTFPADDNNRADCSRSVKQVNFKIYSRWGSEIFDTSIASDGSQVFWNGRNSSGTEVSEGTYFYHGQVIFDTNDPSKKTQEIKGWVQVLR